MQQEKREVFLGRGHPSVRPSAPAGSSFNDPRSWMGVGGIGLGLFVGSRGGGTGTLVRSKSKMVGRLIDGCGGYL